ncbi:MAG: ABC transporter substrate-binding protein [Candidatus Kaistia colombiensis]|nr:MAG: ABC transporter substrate-binding protein [Kaistia sp.]
MQSRKALAAFVLLGELALAACPTAVLAQGKSILVVGQTGPLDTLDPLHADVSRTDNLNSGLYNTLITYDQDGRVVPQLASEWTLSPDVTSIDFTLRTDVKFHDGSPLTADDVVYTLERTKRLGQGVSSMLGNYKSATAIDAHHVRVDMTAPSTLMLGALTKIYILNSKLVQQNVGSDDGQAWLHSNEAGSGAYRFEVAQPDTTNVRMALFDDYWAPEAGRADIIIVKRMDGSATQSSALRAGSIDVATEISPRDVLSFQDQAGFTVARGKSSGGTYVYFNVDHGPTANVDLRRALQYAYDYQGDIDHIQVGSGSLTDGPLPPSTACRPTGETAKQDIAKAKELLAASGFQNLQLTMTYDPSFATMNAQAVLLQSNLRDIGIDLTLKPTTFPEYLAMLKSPETLPEMALVIDYTQYPDPGTMLSVNYTTAAIKQGASKTAYSNSEVDSLIAGAITNPDPEVRCDMYTKAQEHIRDDALSINLSYSSPPIVSGPKVGGIAYDIVHGPIDLSDLRLASN